MSNVVDIRKYKEVDPILRKGDLIKIVDNSDRAGDVMHGIVVGILETFGQDTDTPVPAMWLTIAVPDEDGWS